MAQNLSPQDERYLALGRMTRGMVHDFNNVIASILGYSEFLIQDLDKDSEPQQFAANIRKAAEQMQFLLKQISALTADKKDSSEASYNAATSLRHIVENFYQTLPFGYEGEMNVAHLPANIDIPLVQFHTLLGNLLKNAFDSLPSGNGKITVSLSDTPPEALPTMLVREVLSPEKSGGDYIYITITDNGHGMNADILDLIFTPYFTTKPAEDAHGMGLPIVYGILKYVGGGLTISTREGFGTHVMLSLPLATQADKEHASNAIAAQRILLIEDRALVRESQKIILLRAGHNVTDFSNALDALDYLREHPEKTDVIITDLTMPEMSGAEFFVELQHEAGDIPVIITSGDAAGLQALKSEFKNARIFLLPKPASSDSLLSTLRAAAV